MVRGDELIEGHPEMGLVPQQVHDILGELFCPFYFILGAFFKNLNNKKQNTQITIFFYPFVFNIISVVSLMHGLQEILLSLPSKHTQPKTNTVLSLCRWFQTIQGQNTRKSQRYYVYNENACTHTYIPM